MAEITVPASIDPAAVEAAKPQAAQVVNDAAKVAEDVKKKDALKTADDAITLADDAKVFFKSRTVWVNLIAMAFAIYEQWAGNSLTAATSVGVLGAVNVVLRSYGGKALKLW